MPFKSKAQQRFAYGTKQPWAKEFSDETKKLKKGKKRGFQALPDRVEKKDRNASGSALAAGGALTAGTGLVGGGIPGVHSNSSTIASMREGPMMQRTGAAMSSLRGGIFGYRTDAHTKALNRFRDDIKWNSGVNPNPKLQDAFNRGRTAGKIGPEVEVIRHLKTGRLISHGLLGAGAAATAVGVHQAKKSKVKKNDPAIDRYNGALLGAGSTAAVGSVAAKKILGGQAKRWKAKEATNLEAAQKIVPGLKTDMSSDDAARDWKKVFPFKTREQAAKAGELRGAASQARYFSHVYDGAAKVAGKIRNPAIAAAAVGGGGLLLHRQGQVKKSQLASGAYKAASKLTSAERATLKHEIKGGFYRDFKGPERFKRDNSIILDALHQWPRATESASKVGGVKASVVHQTTNTHPGIPDELKVFGPPAYTTKHGGRRSKASIFIDTDKMAGFTPAEHKQVFQHELAHATPKRSGWRLAQVAANPVKHFKEEARADRFVPEHGTRIGYDKVFKYPEAVAQNPEGAKAYAQMRSKLRGIDSKQAPKGSTNTSSSKPKFKSSQFRSNSYPGAKMSQEDKVLATAGVGALGVGGAGYGVHRYINNAEKKRPISKPVSKSQPPAYTPKKQTKSDYRNKTALNTGIAGALGGSYGYQQMTTPNPRLGGRTLAETPILKPEFLDFKYKKANKPFKAQEKWEKKKTKFEAKNMGTMNESTKSTYDKVRNLAERGSTPGERSNAAHQAKKLEDKHNFKPFTEPKPEIPKGVSKPVRNIIKHPRTVGTAVGAGIIAAPVFATSHLLNRHRYKSDLRAAKKKQVSKAHIVSAFGVEYC